MRIETCFIFLFSNFITCSRSHSQFTINFAHSSWIHYFLRNRKILSTLSFFRIHFEFTFLFANSQWIHYLFREININSLSLSQIHYEFTIFLAKILWIHYLFREVTMDSLSFSRKHYRFIIFVVNKLWIHYHFVNSPWIHYSQLARLRFFPFWNWPISKNLILWFVASFYQSIHINSTLNSVTDANINWLKEVISKLTSVYYKMNFKSR